MKYSDLILKGFQRVEGRQCTRWYCHGADPKNPRSVCVLGAANLALNGDASVPDRHRRDDFTLKFAEAWGFEPAELNDQRMPWEHLYGMARAAGL